jgi:hypothetical protein
VVTDYTFTPTTNGEFATRHSVTANQIITVTLTAKNGASAVPSATVFLAYAGKGTASVATLCGAGSVALTTTPVACTTASNGTIPISFQAPSTLPAGGVATITAQDAASSPTLVRTAKYFWGQVDRLTWGTTPIAAPGSLTPGTSVAFTITAAQGSTGMAAPIYLSATLVGSGGGAKGSTGTATTPCTSGTTLTSSPQAITADSGGIASVCYTAPVTGGAVDTVQAQDDDLFPSITVRDYYNTQSAALDHYRMNPATVIASAGTLSAGQSAPITVTAANSGDVGISYIGLYLKLTSTASPAGTATATSSTGMGPVALTSSYQLFVTDGSGNVPVTFTTSSATTGTDTLAVQETSSGVSAKQVTDRYSYGLATHYSFTPSPIASRGTMSPGGTQAVTLNALDAGNAGVPDTVVYLAFTTAGPVTTAASAKKDNTTALTSTLTPYITDSAGQISITYKASDATGGHDVIFAQNKLTSPTYASTDEYVYGAIVNYAWSPTPIAAPGALQPNSVTPLTVTVTNNSAAAVPAAKVYISIGAATGGGSAASSQCSPATLSTAPSTCTADSNGVVTVNYTSPGTLPTSGTDTITAADAATNSTYSATDSYTFVGGYSLAPTPIAPTGSLTSSQPKLVTLTVTDGTSALPNAAVWLSFTPASGSTPPTNTSTMTVGPGLSPPALTTTPTQYVADSGGHITLNYTRINKPPVGGSDTVRAQNASSSPSLSAVDTYGYIAQYVLNPAGPKIAPDGTLAPNTSRLVTITSQDGNGAAAPGAKVALKFVPAFGGGTAMVGPTALTGTPTIFTADNSGNITVTYTTPGTLPSSGTDVITAANQTGSTPTLSVSDGYTFTPPPPPPPPPGSGYFMVARDGGIFTHGSAINHFRGSEGATRLNAPIVGMAAMPDGDGYFLVATDGGIFTHGSAASHFYGSTGNMRLNAPIVGMGLMPNADGYFLVASDGGIFSFGSAVNHFRGSEGATRLNQPIVGMAVMPDGDGYFLVASDGGIFTHGSATPHFHGSEGAARLNQPIVGMTMMPDGDGYFLVARDGGIFTHGSATPHFHGSEGATRLNQPIVGMAVTPDGDGYYLVASDGGIFNHGTARFFGSEGATPLNQPVVGMAAI